MATDGGNPESEALGKSHGSPKLGVATEMGAAISAREGRRDGREGRARTRTCEHERVERVERVMGGEGDGWRG